METLNTITTNISILAHSHVDWSATAGPVWLAGLLVIGVVGFGVMVLTETRRGF